MRNLPAELLDRLHAEALAENTVRDNGHYPETWYWEAGGEHCPHGSEPDDMTAEWDVWSARHTASPQDVFVCLDAPIGDCCAACSEEVGDIVPWADCEERAQPEPVV